MKKMGLVLIIVLVSLACSAISCSANMAAPNYRHTISAGTAHVAAIDNEGNLWMWGNNTDGQLGNNGKGNLKPANQVVVNGYTSRQTVPIIVAKDVADVWAGDDRTYFVKKDGTLWSMGLGWSGFLGNGTTETARVPVKILDDVISVGAQVAIKKDNSLWSWGSNSSGTMANGTKQNDIYLPTKIMDDVVASACDGSKIAAIKSDGSLWIWGSAPTYHDAYGCLGNGTMGEPSYVPVKIMDGVVAVYPGYALKADGTLWAWGQFNGFGGDFSDNILYGNYSVPTCIMDNVSAFSYGGTVCGAIKTDNTLWMWGDNTDGAIGSNGSYTWQGEMIYHYVQTTPVMVMSDVAAVDVGRSYTVALKNDGTVWTWGKNDAGQLGNGTTTKSLVPVQVLDNISTNFVPVVHSITIRVDGVLIECQQAPYIKDDRTLVPLRAIFEALNASVAWDGATQTITSKRGNKTVTMTIGQNVMYIDGTPKAMDVAPELKNSTTFIPVRAISEAFGCNVKWDDATRTVFVRGE